MEIHDRDASTGAPGPSGRGGDLEVRTASAHGASMLWLRGELDLATGPQLLAAVEPLLRGDDDGSGAKPLTIDLSGLEFIDSTGLRNLLRVQEVCDDAGVQLLFTPGRPQVMRLFEITHFADLLRFVDPKGEALASQDGALASQDGALASQARALASQDGALASQDRALASQDGLLEQRDEIVEPQGGRETSSP